MLKQIYRQVFYVLCISMIAMTACQKKRSGKPRVLVFSKTQGFQHSSIPAGKEALLKLGNENDFEVDTTSNAGWFNEDTLRQYSAVVFLNTTGDLLNHFQ
ncbi:MAG TPA: ThuA domain-containing protein, partial [Anseongella sp.]|nr:ThuA domain-containing protein [Anseongella sp.]